MTRNRTPQSQEKRRREIEKQQRRQAKQAQRLERSSARRARREAGGDVSGPVVADGVSPLAEQAPAAEQP